MSCSSVRVRHISPPKLVRDRTELKKIPAGSSCYHVGTFYQSVRTVRPSYSIFSCYCVLGLLAAEVRFMLSMMSCRVSTTTCFLPCRLSVMTTLSALISASVSSPQQSHLTLVQSELCANMRHFLIAACSGNHVFAIYPGAEVCSGDWQPGFDISLSQCVRMLARRNISNYRCCVKVLDRYWQA